MSDLQFELTDVDPQYFFSRDNLNSLKSSFPKIKLVQRGQTIKALGEKTELKEFDKKFRSLLNYYSEYNSIDPNIINDIVVKDIKYNGDKPSLILYGISGKPILAKTVNQKKLYNSISSNDLIFAVGPAGTGKTYTGVAMAVKALKEKEIKKIILTRPAVEAGENLGYLPGDLKEKLDPYMQPLYDALKDMIPIEKLEDYIETKKNNYLKVEWPTFKPLQKNLSVMDTNEFLEKIDPLNIDSYRKVYGGYTIENNSFIRPMMISNEKRLPELLSIPEIEVYKSNAFKV